MKTKLLVLILMLVMIYSIMYERRTIDAMYVYKYVQFI